MGNVRHVFKWDMKKGLWTEVKEKDTRKGQALSLVDFGNIIHDEKKGINYIIVADGCKLDNHSADGETVDANKSGIANVISYFENRKDNYRIGLWLIDEEAPLVEQSRITASFISQLAEKKYVSTINFIGLSKCGVMALDLTKYLVGSAARTKTRIYSVSAPYKGATVAGPLMFEQEVSQLVKTKLGNTKMSEKIVESVMRYYYGIHSCSHMELDISLPEGVPQGFQKFYDSSFLDNIFSKRNIMGACRVAHFQNICTKIEKDTFKETMRARNYGELGMFVLNDLIYKGNSDGLVDIASQREVEKHIKGIGESVLIPSTHHILKTPVYANQLLEIVDENMGAKRLKLM